MKILIQIILLPTLFFIGVAIMVYGYGVEVKSWEVLAVGYIAIVGVGMLSEGLK